MAASKKSKKRATAKRDARKSDAKKDAKAPAAGSDVDVQIEELRRKIRVLEEKKAAAEFARTPLYKNLRATLAALGKAIEDMDGRAQILDADFIRASRQYYPLLERAIEEGLGRRRRGRKPKADFS